MNSWKETLASVYPFLLGHFIFHSLDFKSSVHVEGWVRGTKSLKLVTLKLVEIVTGLNVWQTQLSCLLSSSFLFLLWHFAVRPKEECCESCQTTFH